MILFRAGRQAVKVRRVWLASLIATALLAGATVYFLIQAGQEPDAGLARGRFHLFVVLTAIGGIVCAGLAIYVRTYVTRIALEEDGNTVLISTLSWVRERTTRLDPSQVEEAGFHEGRRRTLDAPWWAIWLRGRLFPLIVDAQGEIPDLPRLLEVLARVARN